MNSWEIFNNIKDNYGIQGFYAGSIGMLLREIPFNSFQMTFFTSLKDTIDFQKVFFSITKLSFLQYGYDDDNMKVIAASLSDGDNVGYNSFESALLGVIASLLAAIITQPADVVKTKLMVTEKVTDQEDQEKKKILRVFNNILRDEGVKGLFAGLKSRVLLCTLGGLIYFFVADVVFSGQF